MLRRLLAAGTQGVVGIADARRIRLVNSITLLSVVLTLALLPFGVLAGERVGVGTGVGVLVVCTFVYWLNASGRTWGAAASLSLIAPGVVATQHIGAELDAGVLYLLVAALLPFLAFPSTATRSAAAISLCSSLELIWTIATTFGQPEMLAAIAAPGPRTELVHTGVATTMCLLGYLLWRVQRASEAGAQREEQRSEALLLDLFPPTIARGLQRWRRIAPQRHGDASVLFCRVTDLAAEGPDAELRLLGALFAALDDVCLRHGVEKIKSFGRSYMAAAGVPTSRPDHAEALTAAALDILATAAAVHPAVVVRIGVHSGPVVTGIIGRNRYTFDLWGDVVNTGQRMEAHGVAGAVQVSAQTFSKINHQFACNAREPLQIKGKLVERTYLVRGRLAPREPRA